MPRSLAFATVLMLCVLSGWSTAHAQRRLPPNVAESAAKLAAEGVTLAAKSVIRVGHSEQEAKQKYLWTQEGWKFIPTNPIEFDLPFWGRLRITQIDLKGPSALAAAISCYNWPLCAEFAAWARSLASPPQPVAGPKRADADNNQG